MELNPIEENGVVFVEGAPDEPFLESVRDVTRIIEACYSADASAALLYAENMTKGFFDLSSGDAGEILQKLRNYHIRLAVICLPGKVGFSSRFREMVEEESRSEHFGVFDSRPAAMQWLREPPG